MTEPLTTSNSAGGTLPEWAPWAVLGTLLSLGLMGALGGPATAKTAKALTTPAPSAAPFAPASVKREDAAPEKIRASHLVVSHKDSMLGKRYGITRTREEARERALEAIARARKGERFEDLVATYCDEPTTVERKGNLGRFTHKDAVRPFADAAFQLEVGEISEPVETAFGYHVILRTE